MTDWTSPCQCEIAGWCPTHRRIVSEHRHHECKTKPGFFEALSKPSRSAQRALAKSSNIDLSAMRKAKNFAGSLPRIIAGRRTTGEAREQRLAICNACEFISRRGNCQLCGCSIKWKRKYVGERCPILKWNEDTERFKWDVERLSRLAIGITTCERKEPTLQASLESIRAAGFENPMVVEDAQHRGSWNTFRMTLATMIAKWPSADAFLIFQDDVNVSTNTRDYLHRVLWPDDKNTGVCSLYCSGIYSPSITTGWERHHTETYGALALCFTPSSARLFIAQTLPGQQGEARVDLKVGRWCRSAGLSYWIHVPSLVEHTGVTSTISRLKMMRSRRAKKFCEDAATLDKPANYSPKS